MEAETVCVAKPEYDLMKTEVIALRNTKLYKRLAEYLQNIASGKRFTRKDLGF
ncbi:hypothetical protein HY837_02945 [archaeon]|nr:hypothetical protein [archaeon]